MQYSIFGLDDGPGGVLQVFVADGERCDERDVEDLEFPGEGVRLEGLSIRLLVALMNRRCLDKHVVNDWQGSIIGKITEIERFADCIR